MSQICLEFNSKGLHQSSGKEKESCCLLFPSSTKREIRQFHVVVVQRRQRNVQKGLMRVESCCFSCLNLLLFLPFSLPSPLSFRKLPIFRAAVGPGTNFSSVTSLSLGSILSRVDSRFSSLKCVEPIFSMYLS